MAAIVDIVRPGDVITSDLMNRIIGLLNQHEAALGGGAAPIRIDSVQPRVVRVNEELRVFGSGLDASNLQEISVDGNNVPVGVLKLGSGGTVLVFDVPAVLVPPSGKTAVVSVRNKAGQSAYGSVFVLPSLAANLEATFNITRTVVSPPGAIAASTVYEYTYSIEAFTNLDETYLLEPKLVGAPAGWTVAMKNGATEAFIPRSQPVPSTTPVIVVVTTGSSGGGTLTLGLRAKNHPGVTPSSQPETVTIGGTPTAPNTDVEFLTPTVAGSVQKFANGSLYIQINSNPSLQKAILNVPVRIKTPGVYAIGAATVGPGWTVTINNNPTSFDTTGTPNKIETLKFTIVGGASAADGDIQIPVTGAGSLPSGAFTFKAKLRTDPSNPNPV
jgi:hypothetical protein